MDKREAIEKVAEYIDVIKQHFPIKLVAIYGSYINGIPNEHSDIDVAVIIDKFDSDFLDTEVMLYKLRRNIDSRIEPKLFKADKDPGGFLEEILATGEIVYKAEDTEGVTA